MKPVWKYRPVPSDEEVERLCREEAELHPVIWKLLVQRGIADKESAKFFLRPSLNQLHNPFLMKDMDKAVDRLSLALERKEPILIYGDYDVDGTTAVALVCSFLSGLGAACEYYIPDRFKEGYGFSMNGVEFAAEQGYSLIITLDCGIKDGPRIERCGELGIDVIVCDHHNPGQLPPAFAVLDPKRPDCNYPDKGLSGCGVGFKLMQGLCQLKGLPEQELFNYLDLLAISIGADIVPVVGENRALAREGLAVLNRFERPGIQKMLELAGFKRKALTISDVVFVLAPRINAAGRIMSGRNAVRLLISKDLNEIEELGSLIEKNNTTRKTLDKGITESAVRMIEEDAFYRDSYTSVVKGTEWNKGVVGIVASRLVETYYKPSIVLVDSGETLAGSARSIPGVDLYEILGECTDLLTQYGGHTMAAGLSLPAVNYPAFRERFDALVGEALAHQRPVPETEIDLEIRLDDITDKLFSELNHFQPFGPENMKPVFMCREVVDAGGSRLVGNPAEHLKLRLKQKGSPKIADGIAFFSKEWEPPVTAKRPLDILFTLEPNEFNGKVSIQLMVSDLRESEPDAINDLSVTSENSS
jgi:single-stranded-DNA-specific exonuclease